MNSLGDKLTTQQVSLVKQGTLTRSEHLVPPPIHNALMFGGSTCCDIHVYVCKYIPVRSNHHPLFKYQNPKQTQSVDKVYYNTRV